MALDPLSIVSNGLMHNDGGFAMRLISKGLIGLGGVPAAVSTAIRIIGSSFRKIIGG